MTTKTRQRRALQKQDDSVSAFDQVERFSKALDKNAIGKRKRREETKGILVNINSIKKREPFH
jgi:hypothetical protein